MCRVVSIVSEEMVTALLDRLVINRGMVFEAEFTSARGTAICNAAQVPSIASETNMADDGGLQKVGQDSTNTAVLAGTFRSEANWVVPDMQEFQLMTGMSLPWMVNFGPWLW